MVEPSFDYREQLAELRRIIVNHFSIGELQTLCFDMGVDYETLPGEGKADKAREFVFHLVRERRIAQFIEICHRLRPDVALEFEVESNYTSSDTGRTALLDEMFSRATRQHLLGDLGYALQLYRELQRIDPAYPRIEATIAAAELEMQAPYVDRHGIVQEKAILEYRPLPSPAYRPEPTSSRRVVLHSCSTIAILAAIVVLLLIALIVYLRLRGLLG